MQLIQTVFSEVFGLIGEVRSMEVRVFHEGEESPGHDVNIKQNLD